MKQASDQRDAHSCTICLVRKSGLCRSMAEPDAVRALEAARAPVRVAAPGEAIYRQGDPSDRVYNIISGWVGLQHHPSDGRRSLLHLALPGDLLGIESEDGRNHTATALTTVTVCAIGNERFGRLRRQFTDLNERYIWTLQRQARLGAEMLEALALRSAAAKVTFLLWSLALRSLRRTPREHEKVWIPLSQIELAAATGLTAVHVNRVLRDLRERQLLSFHGAALVIEDPDGVQALSGSGAELVDFWSGRGAWASRSRVRSEPGELAPAEPPSWQAW
jgi:CRP-like cAMP-binding protein